MEKLNLGSIGERLKSTSSQMGRSLTLKMNQVKDFLQTPTPESRIIDQATSTTLESPDWGLNLRICSLVNGNELSGNEVVKSIKRKIVNVGDGDETGIIQQRLALELLEACAMNCEKVFSEIASEKVVEEMVTKLIENPQADRECKVRAMELIRAWGESEDLNYLPIFRQTYENLRGRAMSSSVDDENFPGMQYSLESYIDPVPPPESYPVPGAQPDGASDVRYQYGSLSTEQKKEFLEITRNSLEVLTSLLSSTSEPKVVEDDLTINMVDKCKESQPVLQRIVQSTTDDESLLFEALNLNDDLQKIILKFEEMHVSSHPTTVHQSDESRESSGATDAQPSLEAEATHVNNSLESLQHDSAKPDEAHLLKDDATKSAEAHLLKDNTTKPEETVLLKDNTTKPVEPVVLSGDAEGSEKK